MLTTLVAVAVGIAAVAGGLGLFRDAVNDLASGTP